MNRDPHRRTPKPLPRRIAPRAALAALLLAALAALGAGAARAEPRAAKDWSWTATPKVAGTGARVVRVGPGSRSSLRAAVEGALPGDEIRLAAGTYAIEGGNLTLSASGEAERWIAIRGPDAGAPAVLDLSGAGEFQVAGAFVLVEGLEVVHGSGNNLHVAPRGRSIHDVIVRRCRIHALTTGPGAALKINRDNATDAAVDRVWIEENDLSESIGNAIVDGVGVRHAVVRGNVIHDNAQGGHGIFFKGGSSDVLIESNLVRGIRGNAAIQLGGNTGPTFFDPVHPDREGVDQVARNNVVTDCDDSVFEVRGVLRGRIHHNTVVTTTGFAILRLARGNAAGGGASGNDAIEFTNNLVLSTRGTPQYARNDGGEVGLVFGPTLWAGAFKNAGEGGPSIPRLPGPKDVLATSSELDAILADRGVEGLSTLAEAWKRFRPAPASRAIGGGAADLAVVPLDATGAKRSQAKPTLGAIEAP